MHYLPGARRVAGLLLISLLAGCGGGSGGDEATRTEISTNAISFSAAAPEAATPASQVFTATFGEDIAHLAVVNSGNAIANVTSTLNGRTAQISVEPASPAALGPGAFAGAVAVTGYTCADSTCTKLAAGATSTVAVSYQVSPVIRLVTPYVARAGVSDTVVLRGVGFNAFDVDTVRFGDTAATSVTVTLLNGTEIRATHPALPAGTYPIHIDSANHQGEIPSTATLIVQDPVAFAATTLTYPAAATAVRRVAFDAERSALLVVTDALGGSLLRYPYSGGAWGAPTAAAAGFRDVSLSTNGAQLYGLTNTTVTLIDPVTLALGTAFTAPSMPTDSFLKNIAVGNDDRALITTGIATSNSTVGYIFEASTSTLLQNGTSLNNGTPAMSLNGASAVVSQGDPSLTTDISVYTYSAADNSLSPSAVSLRQNAVAPAIDRAVNRVVVNGLRVYGVVNGVLTFFGTLPDTTVAVAIKPDGSRAYTYNPTLGGIVTYDITPDRDEAAYEALGAATPLAGDPGSGARMTISPDGGTLFLAGAGQIVVQPTPAL